MDMFSEEIQNFQRYGVYLYNFDTGGNLIFNNLSSDFHQHYLSIPLENYIYDDLKIKSFYSVNFEEFVPAVSETTSSIQTSYQVDELLLENKQLQDKLSSMIQLVDSKSTQSDTLAIKQVILELRIKLGQGNSNLDFSDTFPYLSIVKNKK